MDTFTKLFGSRVSFVYLCFDRIVILGYPLLTLRSDADQIDQVPPPHRVTVPGPSPYPAFLVEL
jgi:hypothetical protein